MNEAIIALMQAGKWEEAIFACQGALEAQPGNGKFHACVGESFYQLSRYADAEGAFKRAYILDPTLWRAAVRHAQCLERLHRYRDAMDVVQEWLRIKPGNHELQGLKEFLQTQPDAEEHDGWERTRRLGVTIVNASHNRDEMPSVARHVEAVEAASAEDDEPTPSTGPLWTAPIQHQQNTGVG